MNGWNRIGAVLAGGMIVAACGPVLPDPVEVPASTVESDPLLLLAERTEGRVEITEIDAGELLERAATALRHRDFDGAIAACDEVIARFPGTLAQREAWYRRGIGLEWSGRLEEARESFATRLATAPPGDPLPESEVPALIHLALIEEALERWDESAAAFARLLAVPGLEPGDRRAATVRLAAAELRRGEDASGRGLLDGVIAEAEAEAAAGGRPHPAPAAEARVLLGLIEAEALVDLSVDATDPAEAAAQLKEVVDRFAAAYVQFSAAIRGGSPYWAVEAGFQLGAAYMAVYDVLMGSPVPEALDEEQRAAYEALLRARTRVLLVNALQAWEETLVRAERAGVRSAAVAAAADGVAEVEDVVAQRAANRTELDDAAEAFVDEGGGDPMRPLLERLGVEPGGRGP
jgi:tetratricopeptide (TPR) repeat protein